MTLEEHLTGRPVPGEGSLWPAWSYLGLAIMTVGVIVALMVLAITSTHRTEDRETAQVARAMAARIEVLDSEVRYLRDFVRRLEAQAEANEARIEQAEQAESEARP